MGAVGHVRKLKSAIAAMSITEDIPRGVQQAQREAELGAATGGKLVMYSSSVTANRDSKGMCDRMRQIFQQHRVPFEERDVVMNQAFAEELKDRAPDEAIPVVRARRRLGAVALSLSLFSGRRLFAQSLHTFADARACPFPLSFLNHLGIFQRQAAGHGGNHWEFERKRQAVRAAGRHAKDFCGRRRHVHPVWRPRLLPGEAGGHAWCCLCVGRVEIGSRHVLPCPLLP